MCRPEPSKDRRCREQIAELLSIYMIRRTERSKIRGVPVMEDHFANCTEVVDPIVSSAQESKERAELMEKKWGTGALLIAACVQQCPCPPFLFHKFSSLLALLSRTGACQEENTTKHTVFMYVMKDRVINNRTFGRQRPRRFW